MDRQAIALRGKRLEYFTIVWNSTEGLAAVVAGFIVGSVSLAAFGVDSFIEVVSGSALLWRMSADAEEHRRESIERISLKIVGVCFLALAAFVSYESIIHLIARVPPQNSLPGIIVACISLLVMPLLSRAKRRVGEELGSAAMTADAKQTQFCVYLSGILLGGSLLNALAGLWWADSVAALAMVPIIVNEAVQSLRGRACCD